jgi:Fe-S-cluster containining protein
MESPPLVLDTTLLRGFRYACRPDCGLCCFAEPRVEPAERSRLIQLDPTVRFIEGDGASFLASRVDGGACQLLTEARCTVHAARPHPCREFPVHVQLGTRLQASLVLSCPGVELAGLLGDGDRAERPPPLGLREEIDAVKERLEPAVARRLVESRRRYARIVRTLTRAGRWVDEGEVRRKLGAQLPLPDADDFPVVDPPSVEEGIERLPIFFDERPGPVALAGGLGGWEVVELRPTGGVARHLGVVPPPDQPPRLEADADRLLRGYLRYFLERDLLFGYVLPRMTDREVGTVLDHVAEELRTIGATVLSRAAVRSSIRGRSGGPLSAAELADGIRATDQDLLDVATWGDRL